MLIISKKQHLQFTTFNAQDIVKISEFEVTHRDLYTANSERAPAKDGALDRRLVREHNIVSVNRAEGTSQGTAEKAAFCETCGLTSVDCVGHYAYIKLVVPVFHIGYFKHTIGVLQCICKVRFIYISLQSVLTSTPDLCPSASRGI